jgi:hypothetical protein
VPFDLLRSHSKVLGALDVHYVLPQGQSAGAFDLFVQWLYTRKYNEKTGQVATFSTAARETNASLAIVERSSDTIGWTVKAAILAWQMGQHFDCNDFQNYAMERLFAAYSQPHTRPITGEVFEYVLRDQIDSFSPIDVFEHFFEDIVVRNWGDKLIIDHQDNRSWSKVLQGIKSFRDKFLDATMLSLEKRREHLMELANYMVWRYCSEVEV